MYRNLIFPGPLTGRSIHIDPNYEGPTMFSDGRVAVAKGWDPGVVGSDREVQHSYKRTIHEEKNESWDFTALLTYYRR